MVAGVPIRARLFTPVIHMHRIRCTTRAFLSRRLGLRTVPSGVLWIFGGAGTVLRAWDLEDSAWTRGFTTGESALLKERRGLLPWQEWRNLVAATRQAYRAIVIGDVQVGPKGGVGGYWVPWGDEAGTFGYVGNTHAFAGAGVTVKLSLVPNLLTEDIGQVCYRSAERRERLCENSIHRIAPTQRRHRDRSQQKHGRILRQTENKWA